MTDKLALIAGASRGLGLGLAQEFAKRGWQVIGTERGTSDALHAAAKASGGKIQIETLDVDRMDSVDALAAKLAGKKLDLLFVNAGVSGPAHGSAVKVTEDEIAALFLTNAISPVRMAQTFKPLIADGAVIAFMTSQLGSVANNTTGGYDLYRASKAALNSLARTFTAAVKDEPWTVLELHPGWVRTDMGGSNATLSVEESVSGLADVVEAKAGTGEHGYFDYSGAVLPW